MTEKTVSVIIPNYNHAHFLERALQPYLLQTRPPLEIIIVDDGSQDNSVCLVKSIAKTTSLIHLICLEKNEGVNKAIMKGLSVARGDYVVFTAADDIVDKSFLENSLNLLEKHPYAGFSFCDPSAFIQKNNTSYYYPLNLSSKPTYLSAEHLSAILKTYSFTFPSNSSVFNREFLINAGGFIENLDLGADWFACFICAFRHGVCYIPKPLAWATYREDSYSAQGLHNGSKQKKVFFKILDLLESTYPDVAKDFKNNAIVYEYSWRSFFWLLFSPKHYHYLSFLLFKRLFLRGGWNYLRNLVPPHQRNKIRRLILKHKITI